METGEPTVQGHPQLRYKCEFESLIWDTRDKQFCLKNERERELWGEALVDVPNGLVKGLEDTCIHKQELVLFLHMLSLVLSSHVCLCWGEDLKKFIAKPKKINKIKIKKKQELGVVAHASSPIHYSGG